MNIEFVLDWFGVIVVVVVIVCLVIGWAIGNDF